MRIVDEIDKRPRHPWSDLPELADWIEDRARKGKRVILSPETAMIVAAKLRQK